MDIFTYVVTSTKPIRVAFRQQQIISLNMSTTLKKNGRKVRFVWELVPSK